MKQPLLNLLTDKPWVVNTLTVTAIALAWWFVWGFAKCEYPTDGYDFIPLHGRIVLTLLCTAVTGLCAVEALELLRYFLKP